MFRLLGFLLGSAISIAIILMVTGIPEFHAENPEIDQKRFDDAVEKLMAKKDQAEEAAKRLSEATAIAAESLEEQLGAAAPSREADAAATSAAAAPPQEETMQALADEPDAMNSKPQPDAQQWYSFWNPFRSQIAANGFVSQLERVTGLDYRVVRVKNGVYEVAFAYVDDDERRTKLAVISEATGLELPDS